MGRPWNKQHHKSSLLTNALYSSALSIPAFSLSTSSLRFLAESCSFHTAWGHIISDSWFSALLFYSQEIQLSALMFSCPFPLISESSWSAFSRYCFAVHNDSPAPRSHQIDSVPCSYHWQFFSDLKVKKEENGNNQDEKDDTGCNTLISF